MSAIARIFFLFFFVISSTWAAVVGVDVDVHEDVLDGKSWGLAGPYEKLIGMMYFEVDPSNSANEIIVDIEHASTNSEGKVEFSANFVLIKPKQMQRGNGTVIVGVANRGTRRMLTFFNHGSDEHEEWDAVNPTTEENFGDGFLMQQGFTLLWVGWQFDVPLSRPYGSRVFVPQVAPGSSIEGLVRSDFVVREKVFDRTLADRNHVPYPVSDPDAEESVLTVRDSVEGDRQRIPKDQWDFARLENGEVIPDITRVYLESGFEPHRIYEVVYKAESPEVIGLGLAALRDAASFFKHGFSKELNISVDSIDHAIGYGMSQPGRTLRTLVYMGFNEDEQHRKAFDGVIAQIGGAARGSFNLRFGQASRDAHPFLNFFYPTDIFPFTDIEQTDPITGQTGGMLSHVPEEFIPKVYNVNSSYEYWGRAASLLTTTVDGKKDAAMLDEYARVYHFSGAQHLASEFPPTRTNGQNLNNPNDFSWFMRALLVRMNEWIVEGTPAPRSRFPLISDGTLVEPSEVNFPNLRGINFPTITHKAYRVDYGNQFASEGIITKEPPEVGAAFPILVPQVDEDGNELGGLRSPGLAVPLATYAGWNLYNEDYGPTHIVSHMSGSYIPFYATKTERLTNGDNRLSVEERYEDRDHYLGFVAAEAVKLIDEGYLLDQDLPEILKQAGTIYDSIIP